MTEVAVPFDPVMPVARPRRVSRVITARGGFGALGASTASPVGAGSGAGAAIGASQGATVGSAIVPGIGTAIGAVVGAIGGAIAGAINKKDPENVDFNDAVAIWQQNPNAVYAIGNPYLALAGLFDLNITTNIPIYRKFGHMGEAAFVVWLCNTVYNAAQARQIGANDTALTVMSKVVQPAINAWGYGPMSDPHSDLITRLIVAMILQYTAGLEGNWRAIGGDYPTQFNSIPPFSLPAAPVPAPAAAAVTAPAPSAAATSGVVPMPTGSTLQAGAPGSINTPYGVLSVDSTDTWRLGATTVGAPGQIDAAAVISGQLVANWYNGGQVVWSNSSGWWVPYTPAGTLAPAQQNIPPSTVVSVTTSPTTGATTTTTAPTSIPTPPAPPAVVESSDGSQVTGPGTALETVSGTLIYLGPQAPGDPENPYGYPVWEVSAGNQTAVRTGTLGGLLMLNGGKVYGVTFPGQWYALVNNQWVAQSGAPTVTTAATTSTVGSAQASQACTPVTTGGGALTSTPPSGGVVGTTTSGEPITDADIQELITQLSSSSATQAQTYQAVLQALSDQGASVTAGLSNQVASQVAATTPAASAAAAGSNTGLYIVGGGLALLGLLYFMRRRA